MPDVRFGFTYRAVGVVNTVELFKLKHSEQHSNIAIKHSEPKRLLGGRKVAHIISWRSSRKIQTQAQNIRRSPSDWS